MSNSHASGPVKKKDLMVAARKGVFPFGTRRGAHVQPRTLLPAMAVLLVASVWWAVAKNQSAPQIGTKAGGNNRIAAATRKNFSLRDLPSMVEKYGKVRLAAAQRASSGSSSSETSGAVATTSGTRLFALTEVDITPGSPSDEREPAYSPSGDFIAFASTGRDSNNDGRIDALNAERKYHIWVMNRNGTQQRQITGLTTGGPNADVNRDQRRPAWSPDGNQLVYTDGPVAATVFGGASGTELFVTQPFNDSNTTTAGIQPATERRTFSGGEKRSPTWSPSGLAITFASNVLPQRANNGAYQALGQFDIFSINPNGSEASVLRLTGDPDNTAGATPTALDPQDPLGNTTDDLSPAYSFVNQGVIYFSTNRQTVVDTTTTPNTISVQRLEVGRRIFLMDSNGRNKRQITDPVQRRRDDNGSPSGDASDVDDFPAPSITSGDFAERVSFQTNSLIDASDMTKDLNVWSLRLDTGQFRPTPTPVPTAEPGLFVTSFTSSEVKKFNPTTGEFIQDFADASSGLRNPEGIRFGPDGNIYVSNRNNGTGSIDRFSGVTGVPLTPLVTPANSGGLTNPTGLFIANGFVYVGSGNSDGDNTTNAVHRFRFSDGVAAPGGAPNPPAGTSRFTFGETAANGGEISGGSGIEGVIIGPDYNDNGSRDLYAAILADNKINVYEGLTGQFIAPIVPQNLGGLRQPTGIAFDPSEQFLFVSSSGSNEIKRYAFAGPNAPATVAPSANRPAGSATFAASVNGDLVNPEGLTFGPDGNLYVGVFQNGFGDHVNRYDAASGQGLPSSTGGGNATFAQGGGLTGAGYLVFSPSAFATATPTPTPSSGANAVPRPIENSSFGARTAVLETNRTSSPESFGRSGIAGDNAEEDKSADREPAFSRSRATLTAISQLAFASQRRTAAAPGPNNVNPSPVVVNPFGGPETDPGATHDIWTTQAADFTPPILVPQGVGNQLVPVLAPGPQAPFPAPRTAEEGLTPGGEIIIALVLREQESGLRSVTASFKDADQPQFQGFTFGRSVINSRANRSSPAVPFEGVNEEIPVRIAVEQDPNVLTNRRNLPLSFFDDGPAPAGREMQAGAIKGDGVFYCEGRLTTPDNAGDFYIDINTSDVAGNAFLYDNVYGFSTRTFVKRQAQNDLFVSDYAVGQNFPFLLTQVDVPGNSFGFPDFRFANQAPVESYFLTNPGGQVINPDSPTGFGATSNPNTFDPATVDIWRILCRGPVPPEVFDAFKPRTAQQIDPAESGVNGQPPAFRQRTREVAVAENAIYWASPYTGLVFSGPGTLFDAETQRRLTNFLEAGGRLFVTGREVAFALSNAGNESNSFLNDELQAKFGGEIDRINVPGQTLKAEAGEFANFPAINLPAAFNDPQIPQRRNFVLGRPLTDEEKDNSFEDAAVTGGIGMDIILPGSGGADVTPAYSADGNIVGQRVRKTRRGSIESRVVFFSFGFESVNRRYFKDPNANNVPRAANVRLRIANGIRAYFKTGGISGQVINDQTNLPVADFLVQVEGNGTVYFARTDQNGNYEVLGLPSGRYVVSPARDRQNQALNPGFFNITQGRIVDVFGGQVSSGVNFRVIPSPPGSLAGVAFISNGTPSVRTDDVPAPNLSVLVVSIRESSLFRGGGKFAALTKTDAGGRFNFSDVPSNTQVRLIFNPTVNDIPEESGLRDTYEGPNTNLGRRVIPDSRRRDDIIVPVGDSFFLNDTPNGETDTRTDSGVPIVVPVGPTITGRVLVNGRPTGGITVQLLSSTGQPLTPARTAITLADGTYSFDDVRAGSYIIRATLDLSSGGTVSGQTTVTVVQGEDVQAPNINLIKQDVTGVVLVNNARVAGVTVELLKSGRVVRRTVTAADGTYFFGNVPPGDYIVRATQINSAEAPITVESGVDLMAPTLKIFVQNLSGRVLLNGVPTQGALVELLQNGQVLRTTRTLANGTYSFANVAVGNYVVRASQNGDTTQAPTSVLQGRNRVVPDLKLLTEKVSGRVLLNGVPTLNAIVELLQNGQVLRTTKTAADGTYSFSGLTAGTYTIRASQNGDSAQVAVTVVRGRNVTAPDLLLVLSTIFGRVRLNGVATEGALVELLQGTTVIQRTRTAMDGTYSFTGVAAGTYTLRASKAGDSITATVTVQRGKNLKAADLLLVLQTVGGVVTLNGTPLNNALVQLFQNGVQLQTDRTDTAGRYRFINLAAGTYRIRASGGDDTVDITVVVQRGTSITNANIMLKTQTITGKVFVTGGTPTQGARVQLIRTVNGQPQVVKVTTSAANGGFFFVQIPPGTYTLRASKNGVIEDVPLTVNRGDDLVVNLTLDLQKITGRVTLNGVIKPRVTVQLSSVVGTKVTAVGTAISANDGTFSFTELPAGVYRLSASSDGDSVTVDVTVRAGVNLSGVELALRLQQITGRVFLNSTSTPLRGATVDLLQSGRVLQTTTSATDGTYAFNGLAAGAYTLRASKNGDTVQVNVTVVRARNLKAPSLVLVLQRIIGTVTLNDAPAGQASVQLIRNGREVQRTVTRSDGSYAFEEVGAGSYVVRASKAGDRVEKAVTIVRNGKPVRVDLQLRLVTVSGEVQQNNSPAPGVTVELFRTLDNLKLQTTTTDSLGRYRFTNVAAGNYTVRATKGDAMGEQLIIVTRTANTTVPTIFLSSDAGADTGTFLIGQVYQISLPYTRGSNANDTATVDQVFTVTRLSGVTQNFRLNRFDATKQQYVELKGNDAVRRGEGYFLEPLARNLSIKTPDQDPNLKPTGVREFQITLRRNPSLDKDDPNNGYNLIGHPFNPAVFTVTDWLGSAVITPDGKRYSSVSEAVADGVLDPRLFIADPQTGEYTDAAVTGIETFKGYYVRTFVDNVRVILKPGTGEGG